MRCSNHRPCIEDGPPKSLARKGNVEAQPFAVAHALEWIAAALADHEGLDDELLDQMIDATQETTRILHANA